MVKELKDDVFISQELRYYELTNIFFSSPLNDALIEELKQIFFSINNISQIYFQKDVDVKSIETVKYLLEISPTMDDASVEKYILNTENIDLEELLDVNFLNSNTWFISQKNKNMDNNMISIDRYKETLQHIEKVISKIDKVEYSVIEKVALIYDFCKSLTLYNSVQNDLLSILSSSKVSKNGYSFVFSELLNRLNIKNYIGEAIVDKESLEVVIADIKDEKYGIEGIYLFDPFSDYIDSKDVPVDEYKGLNYNYFAIRLSDYSKTVFSDKLTGILNCLIHDSEYDLEKLRFSSERTLKKLELAFGVDFLKLHKKVEDTKEISDEDKIKIFSMVNSEDMHELIRQNYLKRKNKLLNYDIEFLDKVV